MPRLVCSKPGGSNLGFWETAHLPLPKLNVNICISLNFGAKCWVRGWVGGQLIDPVQDYC